MSTVTNTLPLQQFLAQTTADQRELALTLDALHSEVTYASCTTGETVTIWRELCLFAAGDPQTAIRHENVPMARHALETMRRLGGTWAHGCLYAAGTAGRYSFDDSDVVEGAASWVSLAEMAQLTGVSLP